MARPIVGSSLELCTRCGCAKQRKYREGSILPEWADDAVAARFESGDFAKTCRGQGTFYKQRVQHNAGRQIPPLDAHFNFLGCFKGLCCYCALTRGWPSASFSSASCYHCRRMAELVGTFATLKDGGLRRVSGDVWRGLSPEIIDMILEKVLGGRPRLQEKPATDDKSLGGGRAIGGCV